jgi:hypothetical protein
MPIPINSHIAFPEHPKGIKEKVRMCLKGMKEEFKKKHLEIGITRNAFLLTLTPLTIIPQMLVLRFCSL